MTGLTGLLSQHRLDRIKELLACADAVLPQEASPRLDPSRRAKHACIGVAGQEE